METMTFGQLAGTGIFILCMFIGLSLLLNGIPNIIIKKYSKKDKNNKKE